MLLLLNVRMRGRRFDSDLVHHAVSANRVFRLIRSIHRRGPALSENGRLVSGIRSRACAHSNAAFSALAYGVSQAHRTTSTCQTCAAVAVRSVWMRYDELAFREFGIDSSPLPGVPAAAAERRGAAAAWLQFGTPVLGVTEARLVIPRRWS